MTRWLRLLLTLLAGAWALLPFALAAPEALAADYDVVPVGTIDATRRGSMTLHTPIPGSVFSVERIADVDLGTHEGQNRARAYVKHPELAEGKTRDQIVTKPISDTPAKLSELPVGAYIIHFAAVQAPDAPMPTLDPASRTAPVPSSIPTLPKPSGPAPHVPAPKGAKDFVVTLPAADPMQANGLLYDIDIHPKFEPPVATKVVHDSEAYGAKSTVRYTLSTDIPGSVAAGYELIDRLDAPVPGTDNVTADFLEFRADDWRGEVTVRLTGRNPREPELCAQETPSCEFVLTHTADRVGISATQVGLIKLGQTILFDPTARIEMTITARTKDTVSGATALKLDGSSSSRTGFVLTLSNKALLMLDNPRDSHNSDNATTYRASLVIHKVDARTGQSLAGAVFTLYANRDDALARRNPVGVSAPTNERGLTQFSGLLVNDIRDGGPADTWYWAVETSSPRGYVDEQQPYRVRVLHDGRTDQADETGGVRITNDPIPGIGDFLSNTGSPISAAALVGALAMLVTGVVMVRSSRQCR